MTSPLVIAHRGASSELPEQTAPAFRRAVEVGADGLECDVRLSRDGHVICLHDGRVDRTSNGSGSAYGMTLADLNDLDWRQGRTELPREGIVTLDGLLDIAGASGTAMEILIETKHPARPMGGIEREVARVLTERGLDAGPDGRGFQARVMSFSFSALQRMRKLTPHLPLVQLVELVPTIPTRLVTGWLPAGVDSVGPSMALVRKDPDLVSRHLERGHGVYVWTVNEESDVELCRQAGVTAVITDRPREVRAQLGATDS